MDEQAPRTVAEAFARSVASFGSCPAIKPLDRPALTYADLRREVEAAIAVLRRLDCHPGDRVAIWLPNRPEWPILSCAAAMLGVCIVPVNTRLRPAELAHVLRHSRPKVLFTQHRFLSNDFLERLQAAVEGRTAGTTSAAHEPAPAPERVVLMDDAMHPGTVAYRSLLSAPAHAIDLDELAGQRSPSDPSWLFWTSGTTSAPKGVLLAQCAIEGVWQWTRIAGYRRDDRVLMTRPLFYIAGHFWCMLGPLLHGALAVVGERFSSDEIVALCRQERISVLSGNPLLLKELVSNPGFDAAAFGHVRLGYFGGSSVSYRDLSRIAQMIPYESLLQVYGTTELGGFVLSTRSGDALQIVHETCGHPLPGTELRLVDPGTGRAVPPGDVGMLLAKSRSFIDYVGISDEDRKALLTDDGWIRTGDLLQQRSDGRYRFAGRSKDLIKVGGENVTAAEIELVLQSHPDIAQAAVVPVADAQRGEVPFAYVELAPGTSMRISDLQTWCHDRMAPFKIPRYLEIVERGHWPMTATGKIAKHELAAALQAHRLRSG